MCLMQTWWLALSVVERKKKTRTADTPSKVTSVLPKQGQSHWYQEANKSGCRVHDKWSCDCTESRWATGRIPWSSNAGGCCRTSAADTVEERWHSGASAGRRSHETWVTALRGTMNQLLGHKYINQGGLHTCYLLIEGGGEMTAGSWSVGLWFTRQTRKCALGSLLMESNDLYVQRKGLVTSCQSMRCLVCHGKLVVSNPADCNQITKRA